MPDSRLVLEMLRIVDSRFIVACLLLDALASIFTRVVYICRIIHINLLVNFNIHVSHMHTMHTLRSVGPQDADVVLHLLKNSLRFHPFPSCEELHVSQ